MTSAPTTTTPFSNQQAASPASAGAAVSARAAPNRGAYRLTNKA